MARQHVADGLAIVTRQRQLVEQLRADGHSIHEAEQTLEDLIRTQAIFEKHLNRLLKQPRR